MRLSIIPVEATATFESTYRHHWTAIYRHALRFSAGDPVEAEALCRDVFGRLQRRLDETLGAPGPADLGGWLYRITAQRALHRLRRQRSLGSRAWSAGRALWGLSPAPVVVRHGDGARAIRALRALAPLQRVVLCMRVLDGQSRRTVARTLGLSEGRVRAAATEAVQRLHAEGWEVTP